MSGYSETPLSKKLGIKDGIKIFLINAPENYFELIEINAVEKVVNKITAASFFHLFVVSKKELENHFKKITRSAADDAVIWVSWYKKSSGIATDVTEDTIREIVLPTGWVDVKVCAVTELWSGLKIVKRNTMKKK